jgi:hypothetical protein
MPRRSSWRVAQFDTLRLRLIKIAARIIEMKTQVKIHLPTSAPDQSIVRLVLGRLPRLVTRKLGQCAPSPRPSTSSAYPRTDLPPRCSGNRSARQ